MNQKQIIKNYLDTSNCPHCGRQTMVITDSIGSELWNWRCTSCKKTGNVGYNLNEITHVDFPPDKEEEFKRAENYREFIEKYGIKRPKKIILDQKPWEY